MKLTVSEKDKKTLMIFLVALIVFCSWYFGYRNINNMTVAMKEERNELTKKYDSLYPLYTEKDNYKSQTEKFEQSYEDLLELYPAGSSQEGMIVLAKAIEEDTGVEFSTLSMSEITPVYTFGQITSTNPSAMGQAVYSTDYVGNRVTLTMNYKATYDQGKGLISYLNSATDRKYTIDSMSMTYNETDDAMTGTIVLSTFDITGSDRTVPAVTVQNVPVGSSNLFTSDSFYSGSGAQGQEGDSIVSDYDIFLTASAFESDIDSVVVGLKNDALGKTLASASSNSTETVTVTVTGTAGNYRVSYKVGASTYPVDNYYDGAVLNCGDTLDMLIMSSARQSESDKAGAKINFVNSTDKELNVKIINDDVNTPRISVGTTTGSVRIYR